MSQISMSHKSDTLKIEIESLISEGKQLRLYLMNAFKEDNHLTFYDEQLKYIDVSTLPSFYSFYEKWYTHSLLYVKKFVPDRIKDFTDLYRNNDRKDLTLYTYTISDVILGLILPEMTIEDIASVAITKVWQQISILESVYTLIDSSIYNMEFELQANIFDSELDASKELWKNDFLRASGIICGVILEKHLKQVCLAHQINISKKTPTLNDFAELLKSKNVIGIPEWRHIQLMADIRNSCSHDRESEPTKNQVKDLLDGTDKIIKTIF
jgi:hypothetical protein